MYWDSSGLIFVLSILDLIVLFILFRFKVIKGSQIPLILIGNIIFFWYFNQIFKSIPLANHTPLISLEEMTERGSEWDFLHYYDLRLIFNDSEWFNFYFYRCLPTLSMVGVSFFYTLGLKWHRKIRWALVSCLVSSSVFILFPLIENRIWGGLVDHVCLPLMYLCIFFYIIGYLLCRLFLFLLKKYRQVKEIESEVELKEYSDSES